MGEADNILKINRKEDTYESPQAKEGQIRQSKGGDIVLVIQHVYDPATYGRKASIGTKKELKLLYLEEVNDNKAFHTSDTGIPHPLYIEKEFPYVLDATLTLEER